MKAIGADLDILHVNKLLLIVNGATSTLRVHDTGRESLVTPDERKCRSKSASLKGAYISGARV